jgi:hypothetical protein
MNQNENSTTNIGVETYPDIKLQSIKKLRKINVRMFEISGFHSGDHERRRAVW